jgi:hypothetical protein
MPQVAPSAVQALHSLRMSHLFWWWRQGPGGAALQLRPGVAVGVHNAQHWLLTRHPSSCLRSDYITTAPFFTPPAMHLGLQGRRSTHPRLAVPPLLSPQGCSAPTVLP